MTVLQTVALPLGYAAPVTWSSEFYRKKEVLRIFPRGASGFSYDAGSISKLPVTIAFPDKQTLFSRSLV